MLELHQYPPLWSMSSGSPFCTKVEAYLRILGVEYENVYSVDPRKAPRKQMPFLVDTKRNQTISDSECIFDYIEEHYLKSPLPILSPEEEAQGRSWVRCFDHHYYWCMVHTRWIMPSNWEITAPIYFSAIPKWIRNIVANKVKKGVINSLYEHGLGRHDEATILSRGVQDINGLAAFLKDRATLVGSEITRYDMSIYAFLVHTMHPPIESPLKEAVLSHENLKRYVKLMADLIHE